MPKVQKATRIAAKKRLRNKSIRSAAKTYLAGAEKLIAAGERDTASKATVQAISTLDKAAQKGVIHPNNAARRKSRLMRKLNQISPK